MHFWFEFKVISLYLIVIIVVEIICLEMQNVAAVNVWHLLATNNPIVALHIQNNYADYTRVNNKPNSVTSCLLKVIDKSKVFAHSQQNMCICNMLMHMFRWRVLHFATHASSKRPPPCLLCKVQITHLCMHGFHNTHLHTIGKRQHRAPAILRVCLTPHLSWSQNRPEATAV